MQDEFGFSSSSWADHSGKNKADRRSPRKKLIQKQSFKLTFLMRPKTGTAMANGKNEHLPSVLFSSYFFAGLRQFSHKYRKDQIFMSFQKRYVASQSDFRHRNMSLVRSGLITQWDREQAEIRTAHFDQRAVQWAKKHNKARPAWQTTYNLTATRC